VRQRDSWTNKLLTGGNISGMWPLRQLALRSDMSEVGGWP